MDQFYDLANDCGIIPMRDKETGKPFRFLDWGVLGGPDRRPWEQ